MLLRSYDTPKLGLHQEKKLFQTTNFTQNIIDHNYVECKNRESFFLFLLLLKTLQSCNQFERDKSKNISLA